VIYRTVKKIFRTNLQGELINCARSRDRAVACGNIATFSRLNHQRKQLLVRAGFALWLHSLGGMGPPVVSGVPLGVFPAVHCPTGTVPKSLIPFLDDPYRSHQK